MPLQVTLYAHVILHEHDADADDEHHLRFEPYQLSTLLSDNPRILNYLRSLRVELFQIYTNHEVVKEIIDILLSLKLEHIQLTFARSDTCAEWESLFRTFRTAFVDCISTPHMREICLDNVRYIPLSAFADCARLKRLMLWQRVVSKESFKFPQLEALELSDWKIEGSAPGHWHMHLDSAP